MAGRCCDLLGNPLNSSQPVETRLNPAPMGQVFGTSPDGNWIAYTYYYENGKTDENGKFGIYLGKLNTDTTQLLYQIPVESAEIPSVYHWNSTSTNFIVEIFKVTLPHLQAKLLMVGWMLTVIYMTIS